MYSSISKSPLCLMRLLELEVLRFRWDILSCFLLIMTTDNVQSIIYTT